MLAKLLLSCTCRRWKRWKPEGRGGGGGREEEEGEVGKKEMSRDISGIDWTGSCPPSFINKAKLPHVYGRSVSMTMESAGTHPRTPVKYTLMRVNHTNTENKAKNQRSTRIGLTASIDRYSGGHLPHLNLETVFFFRAVAVITNTMFSID